MLEENKILCAEYWESGSSVDLFDLFESRNEDDEKIYNNMKLLHFMKYKEYYINLLVERYYGEHTIGNLTFTELKNGYTGDLKTYVKRTISAYEAVGKIEDKLKITFPVPYLLRAQNSWNRQGYGSYYVGGRLIEGTYYGETTDYQICGFQIESRELTFFERKEKKEKYCKTETLKMIEYYKSLIEENSNLYLSVEEGLLNDLKTVSHSRFGTGIIDKVSGNHLEVSFNGEKKTFVFPSCVIDGYLCIPNKENELKKLTELRMLRERYDYIIRTLETQLFHKYNFTYEVLENMLQLLNSQKEAIVDGESTISLKENLQARDEDFKTDSENDLLIQSVRTLHI